MTNVLIVDDEKIEREGLKYLLSREEGERNVFEASNGKQALQIIRSEDIQLVLTDIKMPHMDGLELSRRAKEENPALQIIIFSGYSDFTFAQEAIRYGVTEYILKPVNPEDFHKVIQKAEKVLEQRKKKESREIKGKNFLQQYFLQNYLYSGKLETLEKAKDIINLEKWNGWHCGILLAVSRKFEGCECLPEILEQLEQQMEEKFYHPEKHVFSNEDDVLKLSVGEVQDSQIMQMISEDITRKDTDQLRKHFACLKEKYHDNIQYSAMYIKFVFSNVIQELFQENQFSGERRLEHEIERLYNCRNIMEIVEVTEDNIKEYEAFLDRSMSSSRNEVAAVKNYIYQHYEEDLNLEMLAEKVYLSSGYLSFIFKKETGMNLNRYIRVFRMEKAKELLCSTNMKVAQVSERVGFANVSYFCRSFREYYGSSPESYRKGTGEDEQTS